MAKLFDKIKLTRPKLNKFDLSHERKFSLNMGDLIPIMVQEILPGDKFRVKSEVMMRFAPLLAPVMHRVNVTTHYFFVPNRIVWDEWEDFITGGREGDAAPGAPVVDLTTANVADGKFAKGTLSDFMGLPTIPAGATMVDNQIVSTIPFRAYQLIYDEYYRDQNLQASLDISKASGEPDATELTKLTTMRRRAWEKDYFTSALPWAQRGAEVLIPIEGSSTEIVYRDRGTLFKSGGGYPDAGALNTGGIAGTGSLRDTTNHELNLENLEEVTFENTSVTINDLRRSIRLQEWLEKNARGGARYIEQILSHFGVVSSDARLQRPEYLGGGKQPCVISEVLSTFQSPDGEGNAQANMAGHGISVGNTNGFSRRFEEHGYVIAIMSVLPRTAYQQGIPRHFSRFDKFDYAWPEFAHLGEQEVLNKELYYAPANPSGSSRATFGYQSRYAEYKYAPSTVHGEFQDTLAFWHMGRIFSAPPVLNTAFIESDPTARIFAVQEAADEHLYCQIYHKVDALRPLPYFGTPML